MPSSGGKNRDAGAWGCMCPCERTSSFQCSSRYPTPVPVSCAHAGEGGAVSLGGTRGSSRWKRVLPIGTGLGEDAAGTSGRATLPQGQYPSHVRGPVGVWSLQSSPFHNRTDGLTSRDEDRSIPGFSNACTGSAQPDAVTHTISDLSTACVTTTPPHDQELRGRGRGAQRSHTDLGGLTQLWSRLLPSIP